MKFSGQLSFTGDVSLRLKHNFSKQHHWAARYFSEEVARIETSNTKLSEQDKRKHRARICNRHNSLCCRSIRSFYF